MHAVDVDGKPDFYFPKRRLVVFADGCFWHGCKVCYRRPNTRRKYWDWKIRRNKQRDEAVDRILKTKGIVVLRFWEHEILASPHTVVKQIIGSRRLPQIASSRASRRRK
jgi:DNA mismatch endonuclease (patch repair protein)